VLRGFVKFRVNSESEDDGRPYRLARVTAMPEPLDDKEKDDPCQGLLELDACSYAHAR
jgi:hypothetical protein